MARVAKASTDALFVNWIGFHGRSADLAVNLGVREFYTTGGSGNRIIRYVRQWRETVATLKGLRPSTVIVMQPPVMALWAARFGTARDTQIVADLHTGVFTDPKWKWAWKGILRSQRQRGGGVIVTNESLAERCRSYGVRTFVLDDAVPRRVGKASATPEDGRLARLEPDEYVLVPLAYAADEPLDEILDAARAVPDRTWVFTGRAPDTVRAKAPGNVLFSGFVSKSDYDWLAANAGAILACTTEEDTMQRAGYEAVSWERPLVTTRTRVLTAYFGDAAIFAAPTAGELSSAVSDALGRSPELKAAMANLGVEKRREYEQAVSTVRAHLRLEGGAAA